jgi:hypothetical protein
MKNNGKHYVGAAGLHGCMANYVTWNESYNLLVDDLASLHELSSKDRRELRKYGYLEMNLHKHGNEYAEISECHCGNPEEHEGF